MILPEISHNLNRECYFVRADDRELIAVTLDKSLQSGSKLGRSRNVLKRAERIAQLEQEDRWVEGQSALGLPKVRIIKSVTGKKKKKKTEGEE
jgi:small basic protein (TIGR04137 family)